MRKNPIGYLGFLGFLGVLGWITVNPVYHSFWGLSIFFLIFDGKGTDERIKANINRACRNAFMFFISFTSLFQMYLIPTGDTSILPFMFVIQGLGSMSVWGSSFFYYNRIGE
ncbi:MAG: DUF3796 domain-containing protein [Candidatus Bathyarchaeota archaeon]|nr:DUF3796 domain-containing protein [Candidatus Bathyarchaeota archaeon]